MTVREKKKAERRRTSQSMMHIPGLTMAPTDTPQSFREPKIGRPQLEMLQKCGISSWDSLNSYIQHATKEVADIEVDVSRPSPDGRFRIMTPEKLGWLEDSEHRLYEENIVVRDSILNLSGLLLRNSESVEITNCIIVGDLKVSMSEKTLRKVYLDRCLVFGRIVLYGIESPACSIDIVNSNCFALEVKTSNVQSIRISTCKISALYLEDLSVEDLSVIGNKIQFARLCRLSVKKTCIDHEQFDLKEIGRKKPERYDVLHLPKGFFEIIREFDPGDIEKESLFQTLSFLRKQTALESDRRSLNTVRLIASTQYQRSFWGALAVRLLGAVQRPSRVLCAALSVLFFMALAYCYLPLQFLEGGVVVRLDFLTACYFSGVTMTTIGYGDIVPLGFARLLAVLESVLGIMVWSLFVVALVRKYID
jgi:hypothetical protein